MTDNMADQSQPPVPAKKEVNPVNKEGIEKTPHAHPSSDDQDAPLSVEGTKNPDNTDAETAADLPVKAKVCCNCCNWGEQACGIFWAIFNLIQLTICYTILISKVVFAEGINDIVEGLQKIVFKVANDSECVEQLKVTGTPNADAKLSIEIIMLLIYTVGSIIFCFAVFFKCLNVRRRALYLLIYLGTIACLPLAYFIPIIIDFTGCVYAGMGLLIFFCWWYISIVVITAVGINITFVFRDWILKKHALAGIPTTPPSQQQSEGGSSIDAEKETRDDKNTTENKALK